MSCETRELLRQARDYRSQGQSARASDLEDLVDYYSCSCEPGGGGRTSKRCFNALLGTGVIILSLSLNAATWPLGLPGPVGDLLGVVIGLVGASAYLRWAR